jgi:hypothetical protein
MSETPDLPQPDPALRRLDRLVGRWSMEGHLVGSDETDIRGETSFGWVAGGFFLEQRVRNGSWREDGTFSGGWRPNPGADETVNVPYDIGGHRLE